MPGIWSREERMYEYEYEFYVLYLYLYMAAHCIKATHMNSNSINEGTFTRIWGLTIASSALRVPKPLTLFCRSPLAAA